MTKFVSLFLVAFSVLADDKSASTAEYLQVRIAQQQQEIERLTKLANEWQQQALQCIVQTVNQKALASAPKPALTKPEEKK